MIFRRKHEGNRSRIRRYFVGLAVFALAFSPSLTQQLLGQADEPKTREEKIGAFIQELAVTERELKMDLMTDAIADLDRVCELSAAQHKAMKLAAKGAVEKYLESWRTEMERWVRNRIRHADGDIEAFLSTMGSVNFGNAHEWAPDRQDVWLRTVSGSLSEEQNSAFQKDQISRNAFKRQVFAAAVIADLDRTVKLTADQREQLLPLIVATAEKNWTQIEKSNQNEEILPLLQMSGAILSGVDEAAIKNLLTENQMTRWNTYSEKSTAYWRLINGLGEFEGIGNGGDIRVNF
ncbi:MAG: hypothetical protein ACI8UO_001299 [Verrucomicrobiales bacterium]|jgi:hypothetical protein